MKIPKTGLDNTINGVDRSSIGKTTDAKNAKANKSVAQGLSSDSAKVELSERAQLMARAKEIASRTSVDNSDRVAKLQKMIDEGSYNVDATEVADRLVDSHMEFPD